MPNYLSMQNISPTLVDGLINMANSRPNFLSWLLFLNELKRSLFGGASLSDRKFSCSVFGTGSEMR